MNGGTLSENNKDIFYVEGYSLDRFAKGEIGLKSVKQQKIGIIFDSSIEYELLMRHLHVADACVATLGIDVDSYVLTKKPLGIVIDSESQGISNGLIENPDALIEAGERLIERGITAIAIVAKFPDNLDLIETNLYREGNGVDPIAGVEAVISHLISKFLKVPCAHAPALSPIELNENLDPRAASEEIGYTFLPSVLIGLSTAPDLIELPDKKENITLYPSHIESVVVPSGALGGEGVLACMERDVNIISVNNKNILNLDNHYFNYPKLIEVDNFFEAAGLILSLREGITPRSIQRPLNKIQELNFKNQQF